MADLEFFISGGNGIRMTDGGNQHFNWTICDVCNKPQDKLAGTALSRHGQVVLWTCDECKAKGFNV